MSYKQIDYAICKQLMLQMLPPDKKPQYTRMFQALEEHSEESLFAGLTSITDTMLNDQKSVRADSLMKGIFIGLNLAVASNSDTTRQLVEMHDDMMKKLKGDNVVGFHEAVAKK